MDGQDFIHESALESPLMSIELILHVAMAAVAVLALVGTFLAVAWSMFLDALPKLPPPVTKVHLDKYTVIMTPRPDGSTKTTLRRRRSNTPRPKA